MHFFCTYFDQHFLPRGLALYHSLMRWSSGFRLWALCMDDAAYQKLSCLNLPNLVPVSLEALEADDIALRDVKPSRSAIEYYFTCTPSLPLFVLKNWPEVDLITYLDADLFFFSDPSVLIDDLGDHSVAVIGHRFPPPLKHLEIRGIFNVGWLSFRRDANGLACLRNWRAECIEWCYDRVEDHRYGDQKYLDRWPVDFAGIHEIRLKGANLAPWNVSSYRYTCNTENLLIDGEQLIFYHFHGMKELLPGVFDTNLRSYGAALSSPLRTYVYRPYVTTLLEMAKKVPGFSSATLGSGIRTRPAQVAGSSIVGRVRDRLHLRRKTLRMLLTGDCLVQFRGKVY